MDGTELVYCVRCYDRFVGHPKNSRGTIRACLSWEPKPAWRESTEGLIVFDVLFIESEDH